MHENPFTALEKLCETQRVNLDPQLQKAGKNAKSSLERTYEPNGLYAAISEAGYLLRTQPDIELTDKIITPPDDLSNPLNRYTAGRALMGIINTSKEPATIAPKDRTYLGREVEEIDVCARADVRFGKVIAQMGLPNKPIEPDEGLVGYQIITGQDGEPIAVRKGVGLPSTLSLTGLYVNNIHYPPGSIFRAEIIDDLSLDSDSLYKTTVPQHDATHLPYSRVKNMAFMRLSVFACGPKEREEFEYCWHSFEETPWMYELRACRMLEIRRIAKTALRHTIELQKKY